MWGTVEVLGAWLLGGGTVGGPNLSLAEDMCLDRNTFDTTDKHCLNTNLIHTIVLQSIKPLGAICRHKI